VTFILDQICQDLNRVIRKLLNLETDQQISPKGSSYYNSQFKYKQESSKGRRKKNQYKRIVYNKGRESGISKFVVYY
jgi:hypothetical protein